MRVFNRGFVLFSVVFAGLFLFGCTGEFFWCNQATGGLVEGFLPEEYRGMQYNVSGVASFRGEQHCRIAVAPGQDVAVSEMYIDQNLSRLWVSGAGLLQCYGEGCPLEFYRCVVDDECSGSCSRGRLTGASCVGGACVASDASILCISGCANSTHCASFADVIAPAGGVGLDSDGDGVIDALDECPDTPDPSLVFSNGCRCRDSDGGSNALARGTAELQSEVPPGEYDMSYPGSGNNFGYDYADSCADGNTVEEWFCSGDDDVESELVDCAFACNDGKCSSLTAVQFVDADNQTKPLGEINVTVSLANNGETLFSNSQFTDWDGLLGLDEEALFDLFNSNPGSVLCANVLFVERDKRFEVRNSPGASFSNWVIQNPGVVFSAQKCITSGVGPAFLNLTFAAGNARSFSKIFFHVREAAEYQENVFGVPVNYLAPEEVYASSTACSGACHYGSVTLGQKNDGGIHFTAATMPWNVPDAPVNREWHEFSHHMMLNKFTYNPRRDGSNHAGYVNPSSNDSWVEGWAEINAIFIKNNYNYAGGNLYFVGATPFNMEVNYKVNNTFAFPSGFSWAVEEMAVASIVYDLFDAAQGGDGVDYTDRQILGVIAANYTFPGEASARPVQNLYELYWALNRSNLAGIRGDSDGDGKNNLDEIFIVHNAYADSNGDGNYDSGEPVGYTIKNNANRFAETEAEPSISLNKPEIPGSYISVNAVDASSGKPIEWFWLEGSVDVQGCEEELKEDCDYSFTSLVYEPGKIHILMPTPEYSSVMVLRVHPEGYAASEPITIKSSEYWKLLDPKKEVFAKYDLRLARETGKPKASSIPAPPSEDDNVVSPGSGTGSSGGIVIPGLPGTGGTVAR
ncbi:hypothetical protein HY992_05480 [Candidatus Micrarchaeota archaeon]|nr:hypothetical protein [Candidatus Micrarchaeota archaeon]